VLKSAFCVSVRESAVARLGTHVIALDGKGELVEFFLRVDGERFHVFPQRRMASELPPLELSEADVDRLPEILLTLEHVGRKLELLFAEFLPQIASNVLGDARPQRSQIDGR
jgi:hypothetical protein